MITSSGPKVLEYNVRPGDPETQTVLPLLTDQTDLAQIMLSCTRGELDPSKLGIRKGYSLSVVLASPGYPGSHPVGAPIKGVPEPSSNVIVFHAGTKMTDENLITSGGRVIAVVGRGDTLREASDRAYSAAEQIRFEGKHFRRDIAYRYARYAVLSHICQTDSRSALTVPLQ